MGSGFSALTNFLKGKKRKKEEVPHFATLEEEIANLEKDVDKMKNMLSGIGWFVLACFFSANISVITKHLSQRYSVFLISFLHAILAIPFFIPVFLKSGFEVLKTKRLKLHFLRGFLMSLVSVIWFYGLKITPVSEAISLKFATPIFITLLAMILLKEKPKPKIIGALLCGFIGILIVVRPKFDTFKYAYFIILLSAFISSLYHVTVKKLSDTESSNTIALYAMIGMSIFAAVPAIYFYDNPLNLKDFLLFVLLAFVTVAYIKFVAMAYAKTDISFLQPFDFTRLVFASILSAAIFKVSASPWTLIGSIVIIASTSFIALNKRYEYKLTRSKQMIKRLLEAKSTFFANMNHELRTPLNAIISFSKIMMDKNKSKKKTEETYKYSEQIDYAGKHLLNIVNNILDISKLNKKKMTLDKESCDLVWDIIFPSMKMLEIKAREKKIGLILNNKNNFTVRVDKIKLKQVILNLLSNAIKFTDKGGNVEVKIHADKKSGDLVIEVSDTGIGIAKKDIPKILEAYMQTDVGAKRDKGTGLGLPISKKLVELHGGKFIVKSKVGDGTSIQVKLPSKVVKKVTENKKIALEMTQAKGKKDIKKSKRPKEKDKKYDFKNKRVVIVDDNHANNVILEQVLKMKNITENITAVHRASDVLETIEKKNPHLIFMDQNLSSSMTGSKISSILKTKRKWKKYKDIPIIMLTADTFEEDVARIMKESKAEAYLEKPLDFDKLESLVRKFLKK